MRKKSIKAVILIAAGILELCLYFAGCDGKKPDEPEVPKDYVMYFYDGGAYNVFYGFHPLTCTLDSFYLPGDHWRHMTVSANGKRVYLPEANTVAVVDLESKTILAHLPYKATGGVAVSPDGQLLAVLGDDLHILNTSDYSVVFHDTDLVSRGRFSDDSRSFYCGSGGEVTRRAAYKVALDSGFAVTRKLFSDGSVSSIIPSLDQSKWFLSLYAGICQSSFEVYDVASDSVIFRQSLVPGACRITLTPSGRFLFYTNSGVWQCTVPPPDSFFVFDVENNRCHVSIPAYAVEDDGDTVRRAPGELAITPDGRWLVAAGWADGTGGFMALDVNRLEIYWSSTLGYRVQVRSLTCQNSP